jgi:hypothetical protein
MPHSNIRVLGDGVYAASKAVEGEGVEEGQGVGSQTTWGERSERKEEC